MIKDGLGTAHTSYMQIALLKFNGAAEAALAQYGVSSLDGLKESDLQVKPCRDRKSSRG